MFRLFIALEPPKDIKDRLSHTFSGIEGAKWKTPEQLHLTLRFIGEVSDSQAADINEALAQVPFTPFHTRLEDTNFFGSRKRPRILWAGVSAKQEVKQLAANINRALQAVGLPDEKHKFIPHITMARVKGVDTDELAQFLNRYDELTSPAFPITHFSLLQSHLGHSGANYRVLGRYPTGDAYKASESGFKGFQDVDPDPRVQKKP